VTSGVIVRSVTDTTFPRRTKFGDKVRAELDRQRISIRKLARDIDPARPEVARRNLARWIGGYNSPSRLSRIAVAEALGIPAEALLEDDDEEADPLVALMSAIRRVVRDEHRAITREEALS
jgi:transcriptional regulator with XRE-family HTH domain